jgi:hypothetical protein
MAAGGLQASGGRGVQRTGLGAHPGPLPQACQPRPRTSSVSQPLPQACQPRPRTSSVS